MADGTQRVSDGVETAEAQQVERHTSIIRALPGQISSIVVGASIALRVQVQCDRGRIRTSWPEMAATCRRSSDRGAAEKPFSYCL